MGLEAVGRFVKVAVVQQPDRTAGGILLPEARRIKTLYGIVEQPFRAKINDFEYVFNVGDKVFWSEAPVGARYMNEDDRPLVFLPPEEIHARATEAPDSLKQVVEDEMKG